MIELGTILFLSSIILLIFGVILWLFTLFFRVADYISAVKNSFDAHKKSDAF